MFRNLTRSQKGIFIEQRQNIYKYLAFDTGISLLLEVSKSFLDDNFIKIKILKLSPWSCMGNAGRKGKLIIHDCKYFKLESFFCFLYQWGWPKCCRCNLFLSYTEIKCTVPFIPNTPPLIKALIRDSDYHALNTPFLFKRFCFVFCI